MHTQPKISTPLAVLLVLAVVLMAANLRAPIIALGPVVYFVQQDLGISASLMGLVTSLPVLCFALFSPLAPPLARRFGVDEVLIGALLLLLVGLGLRSLWLSAAGLLLGTVLLSMAIAMGNVLLPGVVKLNFPLRVGLMTGLFSAVMSLSAGLASGVAVPLAQRQGWPLALGVWAWVALPTLAVWLAVRFYRGRQTLRIPHSATAAPVPVRVWRSRLAWSISLFMGLQSLMYYTLASWLPAILISKGITPTDAGWYGSILQWVGLPAVFAVTMLAEKMANQQPLALTMALVNFIGVLGIWWLPGGWMWLCVALVGVGAAGVFSLSLMFFNLRTDNAIEAARLSAMAQSVGYLVAVAGPLGAGVLFDLTHSWHAPLAVLSLLLLLKCGFGWYSAQPLTLRQSQQNL